jgi:hypothetical protein
MQAGPCNGPFVKRYYCDSKSSQCKVFAWGGCQPNANNFLNLAACQKECHCNQGGKFVDLYIK